MKWNCDAWREKSIKRIEAKAEKMIQWHPYFAIWPVKIGYGDCRWFEVVYRRYQDTYRISYRGYSYRDYSRYNPKYMSKEDYTTFQKEQEDARKTMRNL